MPVSQSNWINPVSFTAPSAASAAINQPVAAPAYRSELLSALLKSQSQPNYGNVRTPVGGLAEALKEGIQGWEQAKVTRGEEQNKISQANTVADLLLGPSAPGAPPNPHRDMLVRALTAGVDPKTLMSEPIAGNVGINVPQAPIKMSAGESLAAPGPEGKFGTVYTAPTSPKERWRPATAEERAAVGAKPGMPLMVDDITGEFKTLGPSTQITNTVGGEGLTPGWKKIDEGFAETYLDWVSKGGYADTQKQLSQLNEAVTLLEQNPNITGAVGLIPESLQPFVNEKGTIAKEYVAEVVQRNLRPILGAQFTENEGKRLIDRAFNPLLPTTENAKRVKRLITVIDGMARAKQAAVEYFDQNGTLRGFEGSPALSLAPINALISEWDQEDTGSGGASMQDVPQSELEQEAQRRGWVKGPDGTWGPP